MAFYPVTASQPRSDLASAGYGNGNHGFSKAIDWSTFPEEKLRVVVYMVDGSGYNPSLYSGYYDNRMPITLLGMIESIYHHDFSAWMWSDDVVSYCNNIGCSSLIRRNCADDDEYSYTKAIKESSYCVIDTHGAEDGKSIEWSMYGIYNNPAPWDEYGSYNIDHINELPQGYFSNTRCVVLMACYVGLGGDTNPNNVVNTLHNKDVQTVIGFKGTISYNYDGEETEDTSDDVVRIDRSSPQWIIEFTKHLGLGESVNTAAASARQEIEDVWGYTQLVNWGLQESNCYIGGNADQIIKH